MVAVLLVAGSVLIWNQYEYLRVLRSRTGQSFPVLGYGLTSHIVRPWRLLAGFDRLVRSTSARHTDPVVEAARQRFLRRRHWVLFGFALAAAAGLLLLPAQP